MLGNRTAKLTPKKDFQWNDIRYFEDQKTSENFNMQKDKMVPSLQIETVNHTKKVHSNYHYMQKKYYKPTYQDRHFRATYYSLYHPSSRTCVLTFLTFFNIPFDVELQDAFYNFVTIPDENGTKPCFESTCILRNTCRLIWSVYVKKDIPDILLKLNREIRFDYQHFIEKMRPYFENMDVNQYTGWDVFSRLMPILYQKLTWHCS